MGSLVLMEGTGSSEDKVPMLERAAVTDARRDTQKQQRRLKRMLIKRVSSNLFKFESKPQNRYEYSLYKTQLFSLSDIKSGSGQPQATKTC